MSNQSSPAVEAALSVVASDDAPGRDMEEVQALRFVAAGDEAATTRPAHKLHVRRAMDDRLPANKPTLVPHNALRMPSSHNFPLAHSKLILEQRPCL